jgi:hypothetical protein
LGGESILSDLFRRSGGQNGNSWAEIRRGRLMMRRAPNQREENRNNLTLTLPIMVLKLNAFGENLC